MIEAPGLRLLAGLAAWTAMTQSPARAAEGETPAAPAAGVELFASTDSDDTSVVKLLGRGLVENDGPDRFFGIALEQAWFTPQGGRTRKDQRIYADLADKAGDKWLWRARVGTDGDTAIGALSARTADWSKEFFVEREIVETPRGVDEGIYYTLAGASFDLASSERNTLNAMVGVQEFTGSNERLHLRGSFIHVVKPELGVSAQLRARAFHSTEPGEYDYFSPKNFVQVLPVVQMRRFTNTAWMILGAAGYGVQKSTGSNWQSARLADLRVESPRQARNFRAFAHIQYSNSSLTGSGDYHYVMGRFGLTVSFQQ